MLLLDVGTVSVDKTRLQSNNWSFRHVILQFWVSVYRQFAAAIKQLEFSSCYCWMLAQYQWTRLDCNQTIGVFLMLSVDKTRLQSNRWSFPYVIVGCWHSIRGQAAAAINYSVRRQDAAAIKQLEFSLCYCWMHSVRRQDAAAIKQLEFSSCYVGCLRSIRRQDAAAIKQLKFSLCCC